MPITYRPAHMQDLQQADALVVASINDLTQRHGFGAIASSQTLDFQHFSLTEDPGGLWVAEDSGEILGFAWSWACGDLWFLAQLFVAPGQQGRGIGNELIQRTFEHARKAGAATRALITFTFNTVSQGLYMRHGFQPRMPIYNFGAARDALKIHQMPAGLRYVQLTTADADLQTLDRIDAISLGVSRGKHHRFLIGNAATNGVLLHSGDDCIGYAYINNQGHIGPLAVARPEHLGAAFGAALRFAADGRSANVSSFIPGTAHAALEVAVKNGMRITLPMVLMANRDFGDWRCYLPRNPGFM